jgi:hypothetical protein
MDPREQSNVFYLHPRRRGRTYCLDCDPSSEHPFEIAVHKDVRTGDILTPCPACRHVALVDVPWAGARSAGTGAP